jgi:acetolactate synthase-1/2/3 large subunit/sulfoacetaldehyde acetyltransferase
MKAGEAVIAALRAEGVDHVFGVVGSTTNTMITVLHGRADIRFVDSRHEEGAAFMAYGYAKASGKPAACITTSGPGTTNLITGVALAQKGRAPVIVIAGDVSRDHLHRDGAQAFDLVGLFAPICLTSRQVPKTERILPMLRDAFRAALTGKKGPVFVDIPRDLLDDQTIDADILPPSAYRPVDQRLPADTQAIERAAALLVEARRPLLLAGGGVVDSGATAEAVALAEMLDMAMVPSYGHHDAVPNSHGLYVGPPGGRGAPEAGRALHRADVILALGTRINQGSTFWNWSVLDPETRIIQVDIDPAEIGRNYPVAVGLVGDAQAVAAQLIAALRRRLPGGRTSAEWRLEIEGLVAARRARLEAERAIPPGEPMMPQLVYPELRKVLPTDCMVTLDAGVAPGLAYDRLWFDRPLSFFNYAGHGGLGMGYAVGLGTRLGRPDRPAVSIQGDGGFLYTSQELNTAVRHGIPLVAIVLNNGCHGAEKAQQQRHFEGKYIGVDLLNPRFDRLAEVYGARGYYASRPEDIADAVKDALASEEPAVIEIPVAEYFPPAAPTPKGARGG